MIEYESLLVGFAAPIVAILFVGFVIKFLSWIFKDEQK